MEKGSFDDVEYNYESESGVIKDESIKINSGTF